MNEQDFFKSGDLIYYINSNKLYGIYLKTEHNGRHNLVYSFYNRKTDSFTKDYWFHVGPYDLFASMKFFMSIFQKYPQK